MNPAQTRYTTTERELLAIVETLKEFRNILLGQQIVVYTDHLNLTQKQFNVDRVMRWRLIIEEFGPKLMYTKGQHNIVADALSRLDMVTSSEPTTPTFAMLLQRNSHFFGLTKREQKQGTSRNTPKKDSTTTPNAISSFPLTLSHIDRCQQADPLLRKHIKTNKEYTLKPFRGGGKTRELIVRNSKIVIPKTLQRAAVEWYHSYLCHPGETRTESTLRQHFWRNNLRETVHTVCQTCDVCQRTKKVQSKYGKLPEKAAEAEPWDKLCIDLIGPYTITRRKSSKKPLTLWAITMIDPATGWFEMREIKTKSADVIANVLEMAWLSRYPWPTQITFDRGSEFKGEVIQLLSTDYGIKPKPISVRNPQANAIIERIHQTIGNMIRTFELYDSDDLDDEDPWSGILTAVMAAVRSTYSTTTQATPMQLVFGRDAIMNIPFQANWDFIKERKQKIIHQNNVRENSSRRQHEYHVGDSILQSNPPHTKFGGPQFEGLYVITAVNDNGTVTIRKKLYTDVVNIRHIKPYRQ